MTEVVWTRRSLADLARIARYVAGFNPIAARRLVQRLSLAGDELASFPHRGRPAGAYRELTVVRPYVLVYRVAGDQVRILRVWHGAQDRGA